MPKWLVDFQGAKDRETSNLSQNSKINGNGQCVGDSLKPKLQGKTDQASVPDGPYRGTRIKTKAVLPLSSVTNAQKMRERLRRSIIVNPIEMMVQCEECRDWFHPWCVGIIPEDTESLTVYKC